MARERISLISDDVQEEVTIESRIRSGEINAENFSSLAPAEQEKVKNILFKMADKQVNPSHALSTIEFVLMAFIRVMNKKVNHMSLTKDEQEIDATLARICNAHDITNTNMAKSEWLFDYLEYAEYYSNLFLENRKAHIERKKQITGTV